MAILGLFSSTSTFGLLTWSLLLGVLYKIAEFLYDKWRRYNALKKYPLAEGAHWFLGHRNTMSNQLTVVDQLKDWTREYGSPCRLKLDPFEYALLLSDPESLRTILSTAEPKEPGFYELLGTWMGTGLLTSHGKMWVRSRRLLTPGFHFDILKNYISVFSSSTNILRDIWRKQIRSNQCIEVQMPVSILCLDNLLKCAFGQEGSIQKAGLDSPVVRAINELASMTVQRYGNALLHNSLIYSLTPAYRKWNEQLAIAHRFSRGQIAARRMAKMFPEATEQQKKRRPNFIDILLDAKDADGNGLTDEEIQNEVDTVMFAGHDTPAGALTWLLYSMAKYPDIQETAYEEVQSVLGDREEITWEDLQKLNYLNMCIKESMRIYTPAPGIGRRPTKDVTFPDGTTVPAGTPFIISLYGLHHNPKVWDDPEKFDPLRFTPEKVEKRSPFAHIPFSAGPRNCVGINFGFNEVKTVCATILKNFELRLSDIEPIMFDGLVLRTKNGMWLNVKER